MAQALLPQQLWPHDSRKHILQLATGTLPGVTPTNEVSIFSSGGRFYELQGFKSCLEGRP